VNVAPFEFQLLGAYVLWHSYCSHMWLLIC
jgi:hypothetical protein